MNQNQISDGNVHALMQALVWLDEGIKTGLGILQEDMEVHDSYDPSKPYQEKNAYFERTRAYGGWLLTKGFYGEADLYYRRMLDSILEYEHATKKHFNKGMAYANLGIAQIAQGKFDAGIAHLLTAEWEDREIAKPKEFILDSVLWQQFEDKVFDYLIGYNGKPGINFTIDKPFLETFSKSISREDRIFLQGTILAIIDNVSQLWIQANSFTFGRLYSFLKDICLLIESLLRDKQVSSGGKQSATTKDLYNLLVNALKSNNVIWPKKNRPPKAANLQEFIDELDRILNKSKSGIIRNTDAVYLARNFTGHHFSIDENVKSRSGKTFFGDLYIPALESTFALMLYLKHINAI